MNSYSVGLKWQIWGGGVEGVGLLNSPKKEKKKTEIKTSFALVIIFERGSLRRSAP